MLKSRLSKKKIYRKKLIKKTFKRKLSMKRGYKPTGSNSGNYATLIETNQFDLSANIGQNYNFTLNDYQRAQEVAHSYKYYRLSKLIVKFIPYANVNSVGAGGVGNRIPQLYATVDRVSNMLTNPDENEMLERGVKSYQFTKSRTIVFKPNLLQIINLEMNQPADGGGRPLGINTISAQNSTPIFNKWLPTQQSESYGQVGVEPQIGITELPMASNPYCLKYYGLTYLLSQQDAPVGTTLGEVHISACWEFKGARGLKGNRPGGLPLIDNQATSSINPAVQINTQPTSYP